jgi:ubiquinone/menaquinone biosynthesis C-methylase UbiE
MPVTFDVCLIQTRSCCSHLKGKVVAESRSLLVQNLLARPDMHCQWEGDYRTAENEDFYERAFDYIIHVLDPPPDAIFLDAGCGPGAHSVRLARRDFQVHAVDFSESALGMAQEYVESRSLENKVSFGRESLLEFSFPSQSFDYVLCWGVLMHIPEVELAVAELARVIKPGGSLVISESNKSSFEAAAVRNLKRVLGLEKADVKEKPEGIEYWKHKDGGALVTREADISWLIRCVDNCGLKLYCRVAGQFSESYTRVPAGLLKKLIHQFNKLWFEWIKWPGPAFGNLLFFRKPR